MPGARGWIAREESGKRDEEDLQTEQPNFRAGENGRPPPPASDVHQPQEEKQARDDVGGRNQEGEKRKDNEKRKKGLLDAHPRLTPYASRLTRARRVTGLPSPARL